MPFFVIFEKAAKFEIVVCCKLKVTLYGSIRVAFQDGKRLSLIIYDQRFLSTILETGKKSNRKTLNMLNKRGLNVATFFLVSQQK